MNCPLFATKPKGGYTMEADDLNDLCNPFYSTLPGRASILRKAKRPPAPVPSLKNTRQLLKAGVRRLRQMKPGGREMQRK